MSFHFPNRSVQWTTTSGSTCPGCGAWVPSGGKHWCSSGGIGWDSPPPAAAPLDRIAAALERIAAALEARA